MLKKMGGLLLVLIVGLVLYFLFWPVPVDPVAWQSPPNPGYTGPFALNERLREVATLPIAGNHGPEDIALDTQGRIYAATHEGWIVRLNADGTNPQNWVQTEGRPLGIDFDAKGNLIVADAYRGLLTVAVDGNITELATEADGIPIRYADDVDVAADGKIYFSDASTKFGAKEGGGTLQSSLLDLMEHGGHGRLLVYDPVSGKATTLIDGINFANGVAVSPDQSFVLVNETGGYRVIRYWLVGPKKGTAETLIGSLPGFPDNISTGQDGRFWVAFASPRNPLLDDISDKPFMRKVVQRMPAFFRPKAIMYGHIIAIDAQGKVLIDLQDPDGGYPMNTSVTETDDYIYIGSLIAPELGRIKKETIGI
jgi:sugar lactone lactonase YvrE